MKRSALLSTMPDAEEAGQDALGRGASALKVAIASWAGAAARRPGILMAPVMVLSGGAGKAPRLYDGRARHPGLGQKRPRGFLADEEVPRAARVAVPSSFHALAVAAAFDGTTLSSCVKSAMAYCRAHASAERLALLETVVSHGSKAYLDGPVRRALLGDYGPPQGGLISAHDLSAPKELELNPLALPDDYVLPPEVVVSDAEGTIPEGAEDMSRLRSEVILAVDVHGGFAALAVTELRSGPILGGFDVILPELATPVLRNVTRPKPGAPIAMEAPIGMGRSPDGALVSVWSGSPEQQDLRIVRDAPTKSLTCYRGANLASW